MDSSEQENGRNRSGIHFKRLAFLLYGVILINFSFIMWTDVGYLDIPALAAIWILLGLSCVMIIYSAYNGDDIPYAKLIPVLSFIVALFVLLSVLIRTIPSYGTDEIALDTYAAYLSLHGINPYVNSNMLNVFVYTGFPQSLITPLSTGGAVKYFVYPALSSIIFMPAVEFGFPPYVMLLVFNIGFFIIQYAYYRKEKVAESVPLLIVAMILDAEYAIYSVSGVTDIVWITFLGLSYIYKRNWKLAGSFFGLSLAFKQIPIVILPFYLYFLRKQEGYSAKKSFMFLSIAVFAFMIPNIPYIAMNAYAWFSNIILIAYQPILGVGIGPSVLSFAGFIYIPSGVFEIVLIFSLIFLFYLYIMRFDKLKYGFFGFPVVIFLLNYRTLENYIIYWPFLFLLIIPEVLNRKDPVKQEHAPQRRTFLTRIFPKFNARRRMVNFMIVGIIVVGAAASAGYEYSKAPSIHSPFTVMNVTGYSDPYQVPNKITSLSVEMNYTPLESGPAKFNVYYRIFTNGMINNVNALLWSGNGPVSTGVSNVTIYPNTAADMLDYSTSFVLEAYYGNFTSYLDVKPIKNQTPVYFPNPDLSYPTYTLGEPYPGWTFKSTGAGVAANYSYLPLGTYVNMNVHAKPGNWTEASIGSDFNFSYMIQNSLSLAYTINSGMTNVSTIMSGLQFSEFAGVEVTFNNGLEKFWIGYNKSVAYNWYFVDRNQQYIVQNTTTVNFSLIHDLGMKYNWTFQDATFSYVIGSSLGTGIYYMYFSNSTLSNNSGNLAGSGHSSAYQQFNSTFTNPQTPFSALEGSAVVESNGRTFS